jgi:two-component system cell cycle sensor histidine kinase/response regulator CckA
MHDPRAPIVMVVDDEEIVDEMIQEILEGYGCRTASYNDSREALKFLEDNAGKVVLLITDLKMPFLAGPDLIKKATLLNTNLLVIAVSGYVQQYSLDDVGRFIQKVLPKPFLPSEMLDAVEKALSTARLHCQTT